MLKIMRERKARLSTYEDIIESLEKLIESNYEWQKKWQGMDEPDIENWDEEKKNDYEEINLKIAIVQSLINEISNRKV